jgi:hypothetical protein
VAQTNYALRLQASLMGEVKKIVAEEGTTINQFINVAVAEKLAALRTERYLQERAARADVPAAIALLERMGRGKPPLPGDEIDRPVRSGDIIRPERRPPITDD